MALTRLPVGVVEVVDAATGTTLLVIDGPRQKVHVPSGTALEIAALDLNTTELGLINGVTAGTAVASTVLALDAQKAVDTLRSTGDRNLGGTGVPGAAAVLTEITKVVTAFADTVAKACFTVTVPNAAHAAVIEIDALAILGAGGAIGAGEATRNVTYQVVIARTAGVAAVATVSSAIGGAAATVAGADAITSVVATASAMTGAVSVAQTFTILFAITRAGAGATNHTAVLTARLLNNAASGITFA